jgi:hypothetical protein
VYEALPGRSGAAVALGGIGTLVGALVPLLLGVLAEGAGLAPTMWVLLLAPVALLALSPRPDRRRPDPDSRPPDPEQATRSG